MYVLKYTIQDTQYTTFSCIVYTTLDENCKVYYENHDRYRIHILNIINFVTKETLALSFSSPSGY